MKKQPFQLKGKNISLTVARQNLFDVVENVSKGGGPITLTEHGDPKAVLLSVKLFERWAEIVSSGKDSVVASQGELSRKTLSRYERLARSLENAGFLLREKPAISYSAKPKVSTKKSR